MEELEYLVITIVKLSEHSLKPTPVSFLIVSRWESIWYGKKTCNARKFLGDHRLVKEYGTILIGFSDFRIRKYFKSYSVSFWLRGDIHILTCVNHQTCINIFVWNFTYVYTSVTVAHIRIWNINKIIFSAPETSSYW